ncbi:MAG: cell division protein ZipA [Pseudomonadota bacterium]
MELRWILVGITVLVIAALLIDAARRMHRKSKSEATSVPPLGKEHTLADSDFNPELPSGKARVVRRAPGLLAGNPGEVQLQQPIVKKIEQVEMFGDIEIPAAQPAAAREIQERGELPRRESAGSSHLRRDSAAAQQKAGNPDKKAPEEVIVVHVMGGTNRLDGKKLLQSVLDCGLRFGEYNIFHRYESGAHDAAATFSMASAVEPGVFNLDTMEEQTFVGVSFFLMLPGPANSRQALDTLIDAARRVAKDVGGELHDQQHSVLTAQTVEHLRQRVLEFERRRLAQQRANG